MRCFIGAFARDNPLKGHFRSAWRLWRRRSVALQRCRAGGIGTRIFSEKGVEEIEGHADADGAVGDVEGGPGITHEVEAQEIDDVAPGESIGEVAGDAAEEKAEGDSGDHSNVGEVASGEGEKDQGGKGQQGEPQLLVMEDAPCSAGIADEGEGEEVGNHFDGMSPLESFKREPFGRLIEAKDRSSQHERRYGSAYPESCDPG